MTEAEALLARIEGNVDLQAVQFVMRHPEVKRVTVETMDGREFTAERKES